MENLNKNQLILLVLLVTFVTSIATGIMTFSLLQQAPIEVTRTVSQVVEKTIQQVAPTTSILSPAPPKEVTTVVVKEEDQVIDAINKNVKSVVRITEKDGATGSSSLYGFGLVVTKDGHIVANRKTITAGNVYTATFADGTQADLNPQGVDKNTPLILFLLLKPDMVKTALTPATIADLDPQLGQTVIALGGDTQNAVAVGRVVSLGMRETGPATSTVKFVSSIETDVATKDLVLGSPLFNLSGDIVGFQMSSDLSHTFASGTLFKKEINSL